MNYNRSSKRNKLILLERMCKLKVKADKISNFFEFLSNYKFTANIVCVKSGDYFSVSFHTSTNELAEQIYEFLLNWNP